MANQWLTGSGVPSTGIGQVTDYYRDTVNNLVYYRENAFTWVVVPAFTPSSDGIGTTWLHGNVPPLTAQGSDGDYYYDEVQLIVYRKDVATWVPKGSLDFIGVYGVQWGNGLGAPANTTPLNNLPAGSFYLDVETSDIYFKPPSMVWELRGRLGDNGARSAAIATAQAVIATTKANEVDAAIQDALNTAIGALSENNVVSVTEYASIALGLASGDERFAVKHTSTAFLYVYRNVSGAAVFMESVPADSSTRNLDLVLAQAARVSPRPKYEYVIAGASKYDNRLVNNSGYNGSIASPVLNVNAAGSVFLDVDGSYTHTRTLYDPAVTDPLGNTESVGLAFTATNQQQGIITLSDNPDVPATDLVVSCWVKQKGGVTGNFTLGSSSDASGAKTVFAAPAVWTLVQVTMTAYSSAAAYQVALRPSTGSTVPCELSVYGLSITDPTSGTLPALADRRVSRLASHAYAPLALPAAITASPLGGLTPTNRTKNLITELNPETVSKYALSFWVDVGTSLVSDNYAVGFTRTENPNENVYLNGRIGFDGSSSQVDRQGRLHYSPGGNLYASEFSPFFNDTGWVHVHMNYGHMGTDSTFEINTVALELLINGMPMLEQRVTPIADFIPRLLAMGGADQLPLKQQQRSGGFKVEFVRYEPNVSITRDEVLARVKADRSVLANLRQPLNVLTMFEGDSTSAFRGAPAFTCSKNLRAVGKMFLNHSRGGSWYQGGVASNSDYIGTGQRRAMRVEAYRNALSLGYKKIVQVWCVGENDQNPNGVWFSANDKAAGLQTLTNFMLDDLETVDPSRTKTVSVLVSMKQSYWLTAADFTNVEAIWAAVDAVYTVQVDPINAPYLYTKNPSFVGRAHDYCIKMHKWNPTDGVTSWANWQACAIDAGVTTHVDVAAAQAAALVGTGDRWHSKVGWVKLTGKPVGSQFWKQRATEPVGADKFSVNWKGTTTLWYELVAGATETTGGGGNTIISGDGQHWLNPWTQYTAEAVHIPSLRKIYALHGV
jgi:hypothetical protein